MSLWILNERESVDSMRIVNSYEFDTKDQRNKFVRRLQEINLAVGKNGVIYPYGAAGVRVDVRLDKVPVVDRGNVHDQALMNGAKYYTQSVDGKFSGKWNRVGSRFIQEDVSFTSGDSLVESFLGEMVAPGAVINNGIVSIKVKEGSVDVRDVKTDEGFRISFKRDAPSSGRIQKFIDWVKRARSYKQALAVANDAVKEANSIDSKGGPSASLSSAEKTVTAKHPAIVAAAKRMTGGMSGDETPRSRGESSTIGNTIYQQIGGRKFAMMTGSKDFVTTKNGLQFRVGRGAEKGINRVVISYNRGMDDYTMEFWRTTMGTKKGFQQKLIKSVEGLYFDDLARVFEMTTGLRTRLF